MRNRKKKSSLTDNQPNHAVSVLPGAGHEGACGVVEDSADLDRDILWGKRASITNQEKGETSKYYKTIEIYLGF